MLNSEDYKFDFGCASCGYKEVKETIDISRVINKLDAFFDKGDMLSAGRLLDYWLSEAVRIADKRSELTIVSEQMGYYRKINNKEKGLISIERGLELIEELGLSQSISAGTVYLNAATTMKAFGLSNKALSLYKKTQAIYEAELKENDSRFAGFYNNYALALADVGNFAEAEDNYKKAIDIMLQKENGNPEAAVSYINMAQLYGAMDSKTGDDIMLCMERAAELLNDEKNIHNGNYYFVLSKCEPAFRNMGYEDIANELERQVKMHYEGN